MPQPTASVIIPCYRQQVALDLTLEALCRQGHGDFEVVVVDDGSPEPITAPSHIAGVPIRVVRQDRDAFGLARARNTGAAAARGDVLIFLDSDMLPVRGFVSAHLRHHTDPLAVVVGWRGHVDVEGIGAGDVRAASESGDLGALFADREVVHPEWIARHWERTNDLTSHHHDRWRAMSGGNLSVSKELWEAVGGADESFRQWGGEDNETAWRLLNAGARPIAERDAYCFHQGEGHEPSETELRSAREQEARLLQLVPDPSLRRGVRGGVFEVPQVVVRLTVGGHGDDAVATCVWSLLGGLASDLRVEIAHPSPSVWLSRTFDPDPRVVFVDPGADTFMIPASIRLDLSAPVFFGAAAVDDLLDAAASQLVGTFRFGGPGGTVLTARLQRVIARARAEGSDESQVLDEFGVADLDLDVRPIGDAGPGYKAEQRALVRSLTTERDALARARDGLQQQHDRLAREVESLKNRRVIRIADRIGRLRRR